MRRQRWRWLRRLGLSGLAGRIALWTIVLGTIAAIVVSIFMYRGVVDIVVQRERTALLHLVDTAASRFLGRLDVERRDVIYLSRFPAVRALAGRNGAAGPDAEVAHKDQLAETFAALLEARPEYYQVRYIGVNDNGREVVRVERLRDGRVTRTPEDQLQHKGDRRYFSTTVALSPGEIYLSSPDLNREFDAIEVPHRPVVRIATPVSSTDGVAGIVVINADAEHLFGPIRQVLGGGREVMIANSDGDYLVNPDAGKQYGFDLGHRYLIQDDLPATSPIFAGAGNALAAFVDRPSGRSLMAARRIDYDPDQPGNYLVLAALVPDADVVGEIADEAGKAVALAIVVVLLTALMAIVLSRRIVRPLRTMTDAASSMARGEESVDLSGLMQRNDETGELARAFAAMTREIDTRERALAEQAAELARSNQDLSQFAYIASHDLQEPLRMVASYLDLLERRYGDRLDGEAREFIGYAVDGAMRMKRLINDLLAYSRAGHVSFNVEIVDTAELVAGVVATLALQIRDSHAQVSVDPLPVIHADGVLLARVFQNLIDNALKYRSRAAPRIRVLAEAVDGYWKFSVRDNGIGVDPRFSEKIFEIFKRLHSRDKYPGSGVGLAICKLVVERHGGRIWIEPRPEGGSVFSFTIPRKEAEG